MYSIGFTIPPQRWATITHGCLPRKHLSFTSSNDFPNIPSLKPANYTWNQLTQGQWKLGGMGFALGMESGRSPSPYYVRGDAENLPFRLEPCVNYSAPETVTGNNPGCG